MAKWSLAYSLIGDKKFITDNLVQEVMASCKGDKAGRSMVGYQRSSATKEKALPYYGEKLTELKMPVTFITGEKDPLVPLKDV